MFEDYDHLMQPLPLEVRSPSDGRSRGFAAFDEVAARLAGDSRTATSCAADEANQPGATATKKAASVTAPASSDENVGVLLDAGLKSAWADDLRSKTPDQLTELLRSYAKYSPDPALRRNQRQERVLIHAEFTRRGIAPLWRNDAGDPKDTLNGGDLRRCDSQFIDILWRYHFEPGFRVRPFRKGVEFRRLFGTDGVDYELAEQFARKGYGYKWKALTLGLTLIDQAGMATIRHPKVKETIRTMREQRNAVAEQLLRAYQNPKLAPGCDPARKRALAERRADFWLSLVLANGSPTLAVQVYRQMSEAGGEVDDDHFKAQRRVIKNALTSVRSRYAGMADGLPEDNPWWKLLKTETDLEEGRKG
jgi:hypothetical protein